MLLNQLSFNEIETMNRAATARLASDFARLDERISVPEDDLKLFFENVPGKVMLDVACGWGHYVDRFAANGMDYLGIDYSPEMLAEARRRNPKQEFLELNYHQLSERCGYEVFDCVWACCAIGAEPKARVPDVLEQIRRILVPDGIALFILPLSFERDEMIGNSEEFGDMYVSSWEFLEFGQALQDAGFHRAYARQRFEYGSMTFIGRKI